MGGRRAGAWVDAVLGRGWMPCWLRGYLVLGGEDGFLGLLGENRERRKQGDGGRDPHSLEIGGGRPPRNYDTSVTFLLTDIKISHLPTFSK